MMRLNLEKVQDLFKVDNRVIFSTSVLVRKMVDINESLSPLCFSPL
jgi:hypothetical protein